jgi:uncharacterized protein
MNIEKIIQHTKNWIEDVVIGCNFCPFASKVFLGTKLKYVVVPNANEEKALEILLNEFQFLDSNKSTETTLLIFPEGYAKFYDFLDLIEAAEDLLEDEDYEGEYQVAHFHPLYVFGGVNENDASNYTNRSPYPMLHILREDSVTKVVQAFPEAKEIPKRNIIFARNKGVDYMKQLLENAFKR